MVSFLDTKELRCAESNSLSPGCCKSRAMVENRTGKPHKTPFSPRNDRHGTLTRTAVHPFGKLVLRDFIIYIPDERTNGLRAGYPPRGMSTTKKASAVRNNQDRSIE